MALAGFAVLWVLSLILFVVGVYVYTTPSSTVKVPKFARNLTNVSSSPDPLIPAPLNYRVTYINLDKRTDRRALMETMLEEMGWTSGNLSRCRRQPGILASFGALGCTLAHIAALEHHVNFYPTECLLVLEDDILWNAPPEHVHGILNYWMSTTEPWSVILLAGFDREGDAYMLDPHASRPLYDQRPLIYDQRPLVSTDQNGRQRIQTKATETFSMFKAEATQTTSAYLVHPSYLNTLLSNYKQGELKLAKNKEPVREYCIDVYWQKAQGKSTWYKIDPALARQRDDYSDIEGRDVAYGI